jgi:hypothetical protein
MSYTIVPIDHSIKLAITASIKRFEFKRYDVDPDKIIDALLTDIFTDLFPHNPSLVSPDSVPVIVPSTTTTNAAPVKERKKPGPKPKAAPVPAPPTEDGVVVSSTPAPEKEKKKPGPKPKPKSDVQQNVKKLNPTQTKKLEKASPGADVKQFINYLNAMTPEEFKAKVIDDHIKNFINPPKEEDTEKGHSDKECIEVEFNDETYFVNVNTKEVYKSNNEDVHIKVGIVGALEFADMEIPSEGEEDHDEDEE